MSLLRLAIKSAETKSTSNSVYPARRISAVAVVLVLSFALPKLTWAFNAVSSEPFLPEPQTTLLKRDYPVIAHSSQTEGDSIQDRIQKIKELLSYGIENSDSQSLGYAQGLLNYWQDAEAIPDKTISVKTTPDEVRVYRAIIAQKQHDFERALKDLNIVLKNNPQHSQARATRAAIHLAMGNYDQASKDCRASALKVDPLQTANCIAQVDGARGQAHAMVKRLESLLALNNDIDKTLKREVFTTIGDLYLILDDKKQAQLAYADALNISPNNPYVITQYSELLIQRGEYEQLADVLAELKSTLNIRLYQTIAASNNKQHKSAITSAMPLLDIGNADSLHQELTQRDLRDDADTAKYWALYYLYIKPDNQQALHYAKLNWQSQKSLPDARLLNYAANVANDKQQVSALEKWLAERGIIDSTLQSTAH